MFFLQMAADMMPAKSNSSTSKACCFCNSSEDNEVEYGKIYEHNGIVTHYYCLLLSSNMEQKGNDDEGILGFLVEDIQKELRRGKRLVCSYCRKNGATLGCCNVRCKRIFHFPCGLKAGSLHQFFGEFRSYCTNHRPKQIVDNQIVKQFRLVDNVLCYICYDKVNINDLIKTLWAPCCRKDAWFHRNCIQQLALSAGYFFKCPLCNNKKDFQKAMLEYGIFVPSQDASWELVPNAFEELLYRHDQCDAPKCLCPKGRKHTSHNAKWELTLCRTCGSQGIHMACGQLKWGNPIWDCEECTSILRNKEHNKQVRLGNSSAIDGSSQNTNPNPDYSPDLQSESDSDTDTDTTDLDSDTDISVGTEIPLPSPLFANSSFTSTSSLDSKPDVKLRPGPRFFKLRQQLDRLTRWVSRRVAEAEANLITNESSSNNDNEKTDSLISKENISQQENKKDISQQESKEDISQQESKENIFQKERQSFSRNGEKSQSIQKENVVTIESDDDDVKFIALKEKTNVSLTQQPIQSDSSHNPSVLTSTQITKSLTTTENSTASKSKIITTIDLSENDNINVAKSTVLKSSSKTESISNPVSVATPQESTLDLIASNRSNDNVVEIDTTNTNEISVLNIKITNVTSLSPEVFEKVPDVPNYIGIDKNTTDISSLSTNVVPQLVTQHVSSAKRSMQEASDITDNSKKIKRNTDEQFFETSFISTITSAVAHNTNNTNDTSNINNTNKQQNESTFANMSSKIDEDPSKCMSETVNGITIPMLSYQKNDLPIQSILVPKTNDMRHVSQIVSYLEGNFNTPNVNVAVNIQQSKENSVVYGNREYMTVSKNNPVYVPINRIYLEQIPNPFEPIDQSRDKTNMYAIPSSGIILPHVTDDITMLNQTVSHIIAKPPIVTAPILNNNQMTINQQKPTSRGNVSASMSNTGNGSSNNFYCDGDAGTGPANWVDSASQKKGVPTSDFRKNELGKQASQKSPHSVFPQVTTNHNTCHQPRLIPRYMNLQDLKFQVCGSSNIQMTLYDTFSVNIPIKKFPKENENRSVGIAASSRKSKESSILASREASCSSDHIDNIPIERQRCDKLFRSSKNENCLINDKSAYVTRGHDDVKENLDPIKSRMLSCSSTLNDINSTSNVDGTGTMNFYGENETVSSDTDNLSTLSPPICNTNIMDMECYDTTRVANSCNQDIQVNLEDLQRKDCARNATVSVEERPGARLFCKETNRLIHNVDFDLNVVNMNKNVKKVSQNDIVPTSQHSKDDRIGNDHTDDSSPSWNGYKAVDSTNVMKSKINNQNIPRGVSITKFNEHNILNKQIDTCDSRKFIRCIAFHNNNAVHYNGDTREKSNDFCLKVSIDLCKIQNLIDSKPELFENRERDINNQRLKRVNRIPNLDAYARQQVRYCNIEINNSCLPKSRELQKSNYMYNVEHMQRAVYPSANTFLCSQKPNQRIKDFDKDILDR